MVHSHTDEAMVERMDRIENKLDDLAASIDRRFDMVDRRFDAVDAEFNAVAGAIAEQRQYTEFAFGPLGTRMDAGFASLATRLDAADSRYMRLERKLDQFIKSMSAPKRGPRRR